MSKRFFPCKTTTRSRNYSPFQGSNQTGQSSRNLQTQGPINLTWSSASSSSRSNPVAMGMTSSTLVAAAAGLSAERRGAVRRKAATAVEMGAARAMAGEGGEPAAAAARRRAGARVWRRRHIVRMLSGHGGGLVGGKGNGVETRARRAGSI